jgi:hypothetical protein
MKSIELLGTRVLPELQKRGASRMAESLGSQIEKTETAATRAAA